MEHPTNQGADPARSAEMDLLNQAVRLSIQRLGPFSAMEFLNTPNGGLEGLRPLDLLKSPDGLRRVEALLSPVGEP